MLSIQNDLTYQQWEALIDSCIVGRNAARNRTVLKMALLDGLNYATIAKQFNLSERQIQNVIRDGKRKISNHL